jgi:hypothetical protein
MLAGSSACQRSRSERSKAFLINFMMRQGLAAFGRQSGVTGAVNVCCHPLAAHSSYMILPHPVSQT